MENFLSCDWGTSTFRLRLIEAETCAVIKEVKSTQGISETFRNWQQSERSEKRLSFYFDIILQHLVLLEAQLQRSLAGVPIIISGMASSSIGMVELPYKHLPFLATGEDLEVFTMEASDEVKHKLVIISGVQTGEDVMRGEETKVIGSSSSAEDRVYILPGTHPKHVWVKKGEAAGFKTYMTGEFFELLSNKSILAVSVKQGETIQSPQNLQSFAAGVKQSLKGNLLHSSFLVRTNEVFKKYSLTENYFYLSGLLIGTELKDLANETTNITIVGNTALNAQYALALSTIGCAKEGKSITLADADEALIKGQQKIYKKQFGR